MAEENHNNNPSAASSSGNLNNKFKGQSLPNLKAIPVKFVLQGGIVLQEAIPPLVGDDGMKIVMEPIHDSLPRVYQRD